MTGRDPSAIAMRLKPGGQHERVLRAARTFNGTCQADFLAPNVCDDGKPITRVPARIEDLEQRGCSFEIIGWRSSTKVYRLVSAPGVERGAVAPARPPRDPVQAEGRVSLSTGQDTLFGVPRATGRHGFHDQEQAA